MPWCWDRKFGRAADLDYSKEEREPSVMEEPCLILLHQSPREKAWDFSVNLCSVSEHVRLRRNREEKTVLFQCSSGKYSTFFWLPLGLGEKFWGCRMIKGARNTELLFYKSCWDVTSGTLISNQTQLNYMMTTAAAAPKFLCRDIFWRPDSLQTLGTKIRTKEILNHFIGT